MSSSRAVAPPAGLDERRAVQIVTVCRDGSGKRGSGYRVGPGHVLTAAHVVDDARGARDVRGARDIRVRFVDGRGGITDVDAETVFLHARLDIAVLALRPDAGGADGPPPPPAEGAVRYGRLGRSAPCEAVGFPRFKLRHEVGPDGAEFEYRDTRHAHGHAAALSGRREGTLELIVDAPGADTGGDPGSGSVSPWEGMSGAAVWSGGCLIGIVSEHRPTDGAGTLTASRVDRWYDVLTDRDHTALHELIGLPPGPAGLTPADAHAQQVHDYLSAALASTREHPYVGGSVGAGAPPLAEIHLGQRARLHTLGLAAGRVAARELTAEEAVQWMGTQEAGVSVLTAGPGGGKTTFLRMALAAAARRRLTAGEPAAGTGTAPNPGARVLPVLLRATDLLSEEPLPQVLSRAVTRDLSRFGLLEGPGAEVFREEAEPGVPWLVMVDGLDEILLPESRREALQTLAGFVGRAGPGTTAVPAPGGSPFRFVVATRPLPDSELGILGEDTPVLELRPFDRPELRSLAVKWFRAAGHAAPEQAADRFAQTTTAAPPATGLGTVPLMAAIRCALGSAAPGEPLPVHRGDLYRRFVGALADRHHAAGMSGIHQQTRQALERYGPTVLGRAQVAVDRFFALVSLLAAQQVGHPRQTRPHAHAEFDVLEALLGFPEAARPEPVPEETWRRFLADLLRHSGLFTQDESGFSFLHRTLADYFAAQALAGDPARLRRELRRFLGTRGPERPGRRRARLDLRTAQLSYVGFLLDAAPDDPAGPGARSLHRLAGGSDAGLPDLEFIAAQVRLGTRVPPEVATRTASALAALATRRSLFRDELRAAVALADLDEERARALLVRIAQDDNAGGVVPPVVARSPVNVAGLRMLRLYNGVARIQAALRLAEGGDERGTKLLLELAHSDAVDPLARAHAAGALAQLDHAGAGELLLSLAKDTGFDGSGRALAARLMGIRLGDRRAHRILADMARDPRLDPISRVNAAHSLARLGDSRAKPVLTELARPLRGPASTPRELLVRSFVRVKAARLLAELGDPRATDLLQKLAHDESVLSFYRRRAKAVLVMVHRGVVRSGFESGSEEDLLRLDADIRERTYGRFARLLMACVTLQQRLQLPFLLRRLERRGGEHPQLRRLPGQRRSVLGRSRSRPRGGG